MLKETNHDYQGSLVGNFYDSKCTGEYDSWDEFKSNHLGFCSDGFDDRYHFVFRFDVHESENNLYTLELCMMLQRKGIYLHLYINNISEELLNGEVEIWLKDRKKYLLSLWSEI